MAPQLRSSQSKFYVQEIHAFQVNFPLDSSAGGQ